MGRALNAGLHDGPGYGDGPEARTATAPATVGLLRHEFDELELRRVFAAFPTGVTALAALVDARPVGMTVNSFTSVSMDPPLAAVSISRDSATWHELCHAERLGISILNSSQQATAGRLARRGVDRFAGVTWRGTEEGAVFLGGSCAWFDCSVEERIGAGDHEMILLRVHAIDIDPTAVPLVFHGSRFRTLPAVS